MTFNKVIYKVFFNELYLRENRQADFLQISLQGCGFPFSFAFVLLSSL